MREMVPLSNRGSCWCAYDTIDVSDHEQSDGEKIVFVFKEGLKEIIEKPKRHQMITKPVHFSKAPKKLRNRITYDAKFEICFQNEQFQAR